MIQNPMEQKEKIVTTLKNKGPCLPVHIASSTGLNTIFAGAFLSDLASDKTIKISNMKVGGSPLYYLPGQEEMLEKFFQHLNSKEKEAFQILKQNKLLEDSHLEPAIRVALRNLKDFAYPLAPIINNQKVLFWRFHSTPEEQAKEDIEKVILGRTKIEEIKEEIKQEVELTRIQKEIKEEIKPELKLEAKKEEKEEEKKPKLPRKKREIHKSEEKEIRLIEFQEKPKQVVLVEKSEFVNQVLKFLEKEDIELLEEKEYKKKDYSGIVRINSDLGKIKLFLIAKEKKLVNDQDLTKALESIQSEKLPILFLAPGNLNKKAQEFIESYSGLLKFKQLE